MTQPTTESYELLEDWLAIWRYADAEAIFFDSSQDASSDFVTDYEAFNADVKAVSNAIGACMQASVTDAGVSPSDVATLTVLINHLWDNVVPEAKDTYNREAKVLKDFEECSKGALLWATDSCHSFRKG